MKRKFVWLTSLLLMLLLAASAPALAQEGEPAEESTGELPGAVLGTVYDMIRTDPRLESFQLLVEAAGLSENLDEDGPFTVFAPTNEALAALERMTANSDVTATDVLLYHVVNGRYTTQALAARGALPTLEGESLLFDGATQASTLNEVSTIVDANIHARNGVVHVVDALVPLPEGNEIFGSDAGAPSNTLWQVLANDGRFDTFLSLAQRAGLMQDLQNRGAQYTVFAPTDEAFADVPDELMARWEADPQGELRTILSYHIVTDRLSINQIATDEYLPTLEGRMIKVTTDEDVQVYLNGRPVEDFNVLSANGVIHVVDEVVLP